MENTKTSILNDFAPLKTGHRSGPRQTKNGLSPEAVEAKKCRQRFERRWKTSNAEPDSLAYRAACRTANELIIKSRAASNPERINSCSKNPKSLWTTAKSILHSSTPAERLPPAVSKPLADSQQQMENTITSILNDFALLKTGHRSGPRQTKNRFSPEAVEAKKCRQRFERRWKTSNAESDRLAYRAACRTANEIIKSRAASNPERINSCSKNPKSLWTTVTSILHSSTPAERLPPAVSKPLADSQQQMENTITSILNDFALLKTGHRSGPRQTKNRLPPEAVEAKKCRRSFERRWKTSNAESDRLAYRAACRTANEIIKSRAASNPERINSCSKNPKSLWTTVKSILHSSTPAERPPLAVSKPLADSLAAFFREKIVALKLAVSSKLGGFPSLFFWQIPHWTETRWLHTCHSSRSNSIAQLDV